MTKKKGLVWVKQHILLSLIKWDHQGLLEEGIERLISLKEFNADRMVSVQFNPSQQVKESKEPVTSKRILWGWYQV